jgi:hypothetical protein
MKQLMIKGRYFTVCGTININPEISPLPYKDGRNLIIPKEAHMDLIEGFHNYLAATEVKDKDKDFKFYLEYDLRILSIEEANDFINQMNKKNPFKSAQVVRINSHNEINYVIDQLNKRSSFHLNGTIDNDMKVYLNELFTNIFGNILEREASLDIISLLESGMNHIVEKNKRFKKSFSKHEWLAYSVVIKYSKDNSINFIDLIEIIGEDGLLIQTKHIQKPTPKNIKNIIKYIKEATRNV